MEVIANLLESFSIAFFILFFNKSNKNNTKKYLGTVAVSLVLFFNLMLNEYFGSFSEYTFVIDLLILIAYSVFFLSEKWYVILFSIILCYVLLIFGNVLALNILSNIFKKDIIIFLESRGIYRNMQLVFSKLIWVFILVFCIFRKRKKDLKFGGRIEMGIFLFGGFLTILTTTIVMSMIRDDYDLNNNSQLVIIILCTLVLDFAICYLLYIIIKEKENRMKIQMLERLSIEQHKFYNSQLTGYERMRKQKHDMKTALSAIKYLWETEMYEALGIGIDDFINKFLLEDLIYKENDAMWLAIVGCKEQEAVDKDIVFNKRMKSGDYTGISGMDFCVILGNLLDNAIEAEEKETENKEIQLIIKEELGVVYLCVLNYISKSVLNHYGISRTSKSNTIEHGFGLKNVEELVKKYNGEMNITEKDNYFMVEAIFTNNCRKSQKLV